MQEKKEMIKKQVTQSQKLTDNEMGKTIVGGLVPPDCPFKSSCSNSCSQCTL